MKAAESQESKFAPPAPDRFERRPLDWRVLADGEPPARDWALEHWLGMGHTTILAALGGIGKTLLVQMIGSALHLKRQYVDRVTKARRVLMWAAEDDADELWRRQCAIAKFFDVKLEAFAGFVLESFSDRDCTLMDLDLSGRLCGTGMLDELREQVRDYRSEVVILDNSARLFGGKENDRNQVTRFVAELNGVAQGGAVLLVAHAGRAIGSEYSGSSAWENASRSRMFLSDRPPDAKIFDEQDAPAGERRYLSRRKANYASRDLRSFRYENGVLVPEDAGGTDGSLIGGLRDRRDETIVLDGFRKLTQELGQQPTDGANSPNYLARLLCQFKLNDGRTQRDLGDAMRRLMVNGQLRREAVGRYPNRNPRFGLVAAQSDCTK